MATNKKPFLTTRNICVGGMFAALMAVISQIQVPMPGGVPVTIQVFGIALIGAVLGWKLGLFSVLTYILIGAVGLPVFAGFSGGPQSLVGMAGGYILAWPVMAVLCGISVKKLSAPLRLAVSIVLSIIGLMIVELVGGFQWSVLSESMDLKAVMAYSFVAFIPKDIVITVLGLVLGKQMRKLMLRAGFLNE